MPNGKQWLLLIIPLVITVACLGLWGATGRDAYTKFTVIEEVPVSETSYDLFTVTGLFDDAERSETEVVRRDEFRFGLFPTPQSLFDKHMLSVASISGAAWGVSPAETSGRDGSAAMPAPPEGSLPAMIATTGGVACVIGLTN